MRSFCVSSVFTMPWMTRIASRRCESSPKQTCLNHEFPRGELKNYHTRKNFVFLCGPAIWNVWNDLVSWQTGRQNNSTKYQLHALRTIISKRKNWNPWDNCQKYALKLFWNAYTWHIQEDLIFYGLWTNLHGRSQNGPRIVINGFLGWSHTFILHVSTHSIATWVILPHNADSDCFKTPILQEILRTQNLHQVENGAFLDVIHLFQSVGCVKLQFHTVQQNQKSLQMQEWG